MEGDQVGFPGYESHPSLSYTSHQSCFLFVIFISYELDSI